MIVEMNREEVLERAEQALNGIYKWREARVKRLVRSKIATSEKWHRRFKRVGLGFLHKMMTEEYALKLIKSETLSFCHITFSEYGLIQISQGYREDRLKKIITSCKLADSDTVSLSDEDVCNLGYSK